MTLSDRIAVMNEGKLEQVGTPVEVYRDPATPFVAEFIGDTNLLHGTVRRNDGRTYVDLGGGVTIDTTDDALDDGREVDVSIRPEDITVANDDGIFEGEVTERYFQGNQTQYVVTPDAGVLPELPVVMQGRNTPLDRGERAAFDVVPEAPVIFD